MRGPALFTIYALLCGLACAGCEAPRARTVEQDPQDAQAPDQAAPDAMGDARPALDAEGDAAERDASVDAPCEIIVDVLGDNNEIERSLTCDLEGPEGTCDALATCLCRATEREDLEGCVIHLTAPRGAITLGDFCNRGVALDEVLMRADWREMSGFKVHLRWTAACAALEAD